MPPARCWRHDDQAPRAPHARGLAGRPSPPPPPRLEEEGVHDPPVQRLQGHARGERARAVRARRAQDRRPRGGPRARETYPKFKALLRREPPSDKRERCFHGPDGKLDVYVTKAKRIGSFKMPKDVLAFVHPYVRAETCLPKKPVFAVVPARRPPGGPRARAVARVPGRLRDQAVLRHVRGVERGAGDLGRQLRVPGRQRRAHQRRRAQGSGLAASRHELRRLGVPVLPHAAVRHRRDPRDRGVAGAAPARRPRRQGHPRRLPRALPRVLALRLQPGPGAGRAGHREHVRAVGRVRDGAQVGAVEDARQGRQPTADGDRAPARARVPAGPRRRHEAAQDRVPQSDGGRSRPACARTRPPRRRQLDVGELGRQGDGRVLPRRPWTRTSAR